MALTSGTALGSYQIVSLIGTGGMGEVYRAHDPKIGRDVAIKVLPPSVAADPDRLARFQLEARTAGALSHPNLVTIYELGVHEGAPFIVMELLEGETLRSRLGASDAGKGTQSGSSGLRVLTARKGVEVATQIAEGLAAAHEKGIIHRDLKPENIFIAPDGRVKILDFGLAKLQNVFESQQSDSQTVQRVTSPGAVMGTVGYMSPEQVRGLPVDQRSDIFSFGAILYEIFSGRRAFAGDSSVETLNAILREDPPELGSTGTRVIPAFERVVRRCLEKAPEERFHSAHDVAFALEAIAGGVDSGETPAIPLMPDMRRTGGAALLGLGAGGAIIAAMFGFGMPDPPPVSPLMTASYHQLTHDQGIETDPEISPDGKSFLYSLLDEQGSDIYLRRVDGRIAINLTRNASDRNLHPAFSPDGEQIAFRSERAGGGIFLMGATGESIRRISDEGFHPAWSPDGKRIAYSADMVFEPTSRSGQSAITVLDLASGKKHKLPIEDGVQPQWSPDGRRIAYWTINAAGERDIFTIAVDDPEAVPVAITDGPVLEWNPVWAPDGKHIYFVTDRNGTMNLWRVPLDARGEGPAGEAEPVTTTSPWSGWFSISADGRRMLYATRQDQAELEWLTVDPGTLQGIGEPNRVMAGTLQIRNYAASPDGEWVAFTTANQPEDLFLIRSDGSEVRQLTNDSYRDRAPAWSPDGESIAFYSNREDVYEIWTIGTDGSGLTRVSAIPGVSPMFPAWSPEGRRIAASTMNGETYIFDMTASLPVRDQKPVPRMSDRIFVSMSWLPDGSGLVGLSTRGLEGSWMGAPTVFDIHSGEYRAYDGAAQVAGASASGDRLIVLNPGEGLRTIERSTGSSRRLADNGGKKDAALLFGSPQFLALNDTRAFLYRQQNEENIWMMELAPESGDSP